MLGGENMIDPAELSNEHIFEIRALVGEYSFRLTDLSSVNIRVKVWHTDVSYGGDRYTYTISHHVHTPKQAGPYYPSAPFGYDQQSTVERAIRDTLAFWPSKSDGLEPSEDWLIENDNF
jgi:hypothetical protein